MASQLEVVCSKRSENEDCNPVHTYISRMFVTRGRMAFHYVYILVSERDSKRHYTGLTQDLESRLKAHNSGQVPHTSKYRPWYIETAVAFRSREKAAGFATQ